MSKPYSIGVDLGGTYHKIASHNGGVDFLDTITVPARLSEGRDRVAQDMCEAIQALAARQQNTHRLQGMRLRFS